MRTPDGQFRAFSAVCTHLDCTVQYKADTSQIWCACHNGLYDLSGNVVSGPPPRPLETLRGEPARRARAGRSRHLPHLSRAKGAGAVTQQLFAWLDERLDLSALRHFVAEKSVPVHRHKVWYYMGGITLFLVGVQVATGILLLLYYRPSAGEAYESVQVHRHAGGVRLADPQPPQLVGQPADPHGVRAPVQHAVPARRTASRAS